MRIVSEEATRSRPRLVLEIFAGLFVTAIVAAVLFPVYTGGRPSPSISCLSNIKQISTSNLIYASDNDECLPPAFTFESSAKTQQFMDAIYPYSKNNTVLLCQEDEQKVKKEFAGGVQESIPGKISYVHCLALKGFISGFSMGQRVLRIADLEHPETVTFMRDPIRGFGPTKASNSFLSPHGDRFALSYLDGHAKRLGPIKEFKEL